MNVTLYCKGLFSLVSSFSRLKIQAKVLGDVFGTRIYGTVLTISLDIGSVGKNVEHHIYAARELVAEQEHIRWRN